jgi:butyryl-CoA dehydrogenase
MKVFAGVVLAWQWLRQINTAEQRLSSELTADQADFYQGKCQAGQYFVRWELPQIDHYIALLQNRDDSCHNMKTNWF